MSSSPLSDVLRLAVTAAEKGGQIVHEVFSSGSWVWLKNRRKTIFNLSGSNSVRCASFIISQGLSRPQGDQRGGKALL
ncbi:32_5-bisphosphate nucleotidase 1 [Caligus rogercresseyi]|uniref:32_5-bisphosphate nucleotidase 1 n=1 Tax=Caligus rogercresseyi TaxID=217165 RepID=A0A7T8KLR8_CALRO|nr:32_5-bisphosphate nucleotidase 1 [Caligus rogercresseyi]